MFGRVKEKKVIGANKAFVLFVAIKLALSHQISNLLYVVTQ